MLVYIWYQGQHKLALRVLQGRKYNTYVVNKDTGIALVKQRKEEPSVACIEGGVPRSPSMYASQYLALGREKGITNGAKVALEGLL